MWARIGNGGWAEIEDSEWDLPGRTYVRMSEVEGVERITELYIDGRGEPIQGGALKRFPLAMVEQWLSGLSLQRRGVAGPDLSRLASHFATNWGDTERNRRNWVALSWLAQYKPTGVEQVPMGDKSRPEPAEFELPPLRLQPPESGLTDAFLSDVAAAYDGAIARGLTPAAAIADLTNVTRKTAQSWIYKARKRGVMAPAKSKGRIV